MARYPTKHKSETRERILLPRRTASIKDRGIERASVDAVMRGAELTVGGSMPTSTPRTIWLAKRCSSALNAAWSDYSLRWPTIEDDRAWLTALIHRYLHQVDESRLPPHAR